MALTPAEISRRYRERHPEKVKASEAAYREKHPERVKATQAAYRERNRDAQADKALAYYYAHHEQRLIYMRTHPKKSRIKGTPENDAALVAARVQSAAYYANHREEKRAANAAWYAAHPEKRRLFAVKYRVNHPDEVRELNRRRRALLRGLYVEKVSLAVVVERDKGICGICRKPVAEKDRSIDHILPVSKGGKHAYSNVRLAHFLCNVRRGNRGAAQLRLVG